MTFPPRPDAFVRLHDDLAAEIAAQPAPEPDTTLTAPGGFCANTIAFRVDARLDPNYVPTPEERAETERWRAQHDADVRHAWETYDSALEVLARVAEPLALKVLDLHKPVEATGSVYCHGCDAGGYDWTYPEWPCRTATTVAEVYGVTLPDAHHLDLTYDHDTKTYRRPE